MKRQINPQNNLTGMQNDSEESIEGEEADVLQQNLSNEIKRQRLGLTHSESTELHENASSSAVITREEESESEEENEDNEVQSSSSETTEIDVQANQSSGCTEEKILTVKFLIDHSDLIQQVISDGGLLLSASLDTTVKVWNAVDGEQICSLRGHTGSINATILLDSEDSKSLAEELKCHNAERCIVSGSQDCSLKIWAFPTGMQLKSLYVYSGINCMCYLGEKKIILGTDGGKLQIWNIITNSVLASVNAYTDRVSKLEVSGEFITSVSEDGRFKLWHNVEGQLQEQTQTVKFENQETKLQFLSISEEKLYLATSDSSLYSLDLRTNGTERLKDSIKRSTKTSALCVAGNKIFLSWYDHECDLSCIDVYILPGCEYKYSLVGEVSVIKCICCIQSSDNTFTIATGGKQLIMWKYSNQSHTFNRTNEDVKFQVVSRHPHESSQEGSNANSKSLREYVYEHENERTLTQRWCTIL